VERTRRAKAIFGHLSFQVLVALVLAVALGYFFPAVARKTEWMGISFIFLIKIFIPPIILLTIVSGIIGLGDLRKVGRIGVKALVYFEVVTTIALAIGIVLALTLRPGKISRAGLSLADPSRYTKPGASGINWLTFFRDNLTLQVLVLAILVGIGISLANQRTQAKRIIEPVTRVVFRLLRYCMALAPLGAFGGMASTIGRFGLQTLVPLARLMLAIYCTMGFFIVVVLGLILRHFGFSIWKYLRLIKEEILIVLGTSSSEAALPFLMEKMVQAGCSRSVVGLVVPAGYSFNLDGTSIYLSMSALFLAQLYQVPMTAGETLSMLGILMLTSKGAAGVTGSGFIVLASTLSALGKIPLEGLAFLLAIDKFMSEARAITNIIGNGVATLVIAKSEQDFRAPEGGGVLR
jgi:aerobic C4-dicarboxylate transport protein